MKKPSIILMGSKPGSVVALSVMLERGWDVKAVVASSKPNYPWIPGPTLHEYARGRNLSVFSSQDHLSSDMTADFVISYMFRYLVKVETRALAGRAALNFHAGPLPEFGGWAFYNLAILESATEYGCTCHYMDDNFDSGPLLKVRRFPINSSSETALTLEQKTQGEMVRLFIEFCDLAEGDEPLPVEIQDNSKMRYLSKPHFESLKEIPLDADAETIERYARAFWYPPYQCAFLSVGGTRIEVIPQLVKQELGTLLHGKDFVLLKKAATRK